MIETRMRATVQPAFNMIGASLIPYLSPTMITFAAFITGLLSAYCVATYHTTHALIFLLLSGVLDILDGTVARLTNTAHPLGAYIDLISDRMVEAALIIGFAIAYPAHYFAYILFLTAVLFHFSSFLAAGALFPNAGTKSMHYDRSAIERAEAFTVFAAMMAFPGILYQLLMALNGAIFLCGITRMKRVTDFSKTLRAEHSQN